MHDYLTPVNDGLRMREAGPWAREKLDYVQRYIDLFEKAMRYRWQERNYIDLMAGLGKNCVRETGAVLLGSPLLALATRYPFTGHYFVDLDAANIEALRQRCTASALAASVHTMVGDCNAVVDQIVASLRPHEHRSLNLAFLDPEGLELQWATVAKLASIRRMDLILNYPEGSLNRFMKQASREATDTVVDRFFGDRRWREIYREWERSGRSPLHRPLIDLYKSKLASLGYVELRQGEEPLMRNVARRAPLYRLLFASKHPLGDRFWHEVTQRDLYGQRRLLDAG